MARGIRKNKLPQVGDRVMFTPLRIKGTVEYVDHPTLYVPHLYPIQLQLDKPWDPDTSDSTMLRANLSEIRPLRRRKRRRKAKV